MIDLSATSAARTSMNTSLAMNHSTHPRKETYLNVRQKINLLTLACGLAVALFVGTSSQSTDAFTLSAILFVLAAILTGWLRGGGRGRG